MLKSFQIAESNRMPQKDRLLFFIGAASCIMLGLLLRIIYLIQYPVQPRDSFFYNNIAENTNQIKEILLETRNVPLSIFLFKVADSFLGLGYIKSGIALNVTLSIFTILFFYIITLILFRNQMLSFFSGLILASNSFLVSNSCKLLRESSYLFFGTLSFLIFLVSIKKKNPLYLFVAGIASVLSLLCKLEGLEIIFIQTFIIMFLKLNIGKKTKWIAILYAGFILSLALFIISSDISLNELYSLFHYASEKVNG